MAYSTNPSIFLARESLLVEVAAGHPQVWNCQPDRGGTQRLAYSIREALYIASLYPERFPAHAQAYESFAIHVVSPGRIEARFKNQPVAVTTQRGDFTPEHGIQSSNAGFKTVPQVSLQSADSCVASWQNHLPSSDPILLSNTVLSDHELLKLYSFCQSNVPRLMMLVGDNHITLSLYEVEVGALAAWHPAAPVAAPEDFQV